MVQSGTLMRILLVDDDPIFLDITGRIIRRGGNAVETAGDGAEALDRLRAEAARPDAVPFQLVVSDWEMPRLTGVELCRAVRAEFGRTPYFLLLTGKGAAARFEGLYAGADDFLSKPFDIADLHGSIRAAELILQPSATKRRTV